MPHGIWRAIAYCEQGIARKEREIQIARAFVPKGPGARHRSLPRHPHSPLPTVFETFADHPGIRDRPATVADNLGFWYFPYDRDARAERRNGVTAADARLAQESVAKASRRVARTLDWCRTQRESPKSNVPLFELLCSGYFNRS